MKKILYIVLLFLISGTFPVFSQIRVTLVDELEPLYPDTEIKDELLQTTLHAALNSFAGTHIFLNGLDQNEILNIELVDNCLLGKPDYFRLLDVPVEINTGIESRTEKWDDKINPHVIRRAPFRVYEILQPKKMPMLANGPVTALRLQWKISPEISPGNYLAKLKLSVADSSRLLTLNIQVHDVAVPAVSAISYGYTNWFSLDQIAKRHFLKKWSEEFWDVLQKYAELMFYARQNMFWVPLPDFVELKENGPALQGERLVRYIKLFQDVGLPIIEFSPFARRSGGDWSAKTISSAIRSDLLATSAEGILFHNKLFRQLSKVIQENNWQNTCRFHIADEPTDDLAADYKKFADLLKKSIPDVRIMEATMTTALSGVVDIWTPQLHEFQANQDFFKKQKQNGSDVWVYSCLIPGGPWLNRLLDQERLRPVYIGWSLPSFGLDGFLHWGLNHYNSDNPFDQSVVDHPQAPNSNNQLPAGDTHLVYPGTNGPWSSVRLEAHRIGMEDAELLRLLLNKNSDKAKTLIKKLFRAFDDYEKSVEVYRRVKKELLILHEKL